MENKEQNKRLIEYIFPFLLVMVFIGGLCTGLLIHKATEIPKQEAKADSTIVNLGTFGTWKQKGKPGPIIKTVFNH